MTRKVFVIIARPSLFAQHGGWVIVMEAIKAGALERC